MIHFHLLNPSNACNYLFRKKLNSHRFYFQKRQVLEETNQLDPRMSALEDDMDEEDMEEDEEDLIKKVKIFNVLRIG